MLARTVSNAVLGIEGYLVDVEVDISNGMPAFNIVGLPSLAVSEAKERVRAAIKNSGYPFPVKRIIVNLAPADIRKEGAAFDLPIAIGILLATGVINKSSLTEYTFIGELSLDGQIKRVNGVLSMALAARKEGKKGIILATDNAREASVVEGVEVIGVKSLKETVDYLNGEFEVEKANFDLKEIDGENYSIDFEMVKGQEQAKRALEVAAAGGHNVIMIGPPGSGKTMLAKCLSTILPKLTKEEAIEVTQIFSIVGKVMDSRSLITERPFRSPHHTISNVGLIGGGRMPRPGEVSLAHNGLLFLDELTEFKKSVLEVLRQPLEEGKVSISRALTSLEYPASFILVAALNPCPCGYFGDDSQECSCSPEKIRNYLNKISGPLLDRIDIHLEVPRLGVDDLMRYKKGERSTSIKAQVEEARLIQAKRFKGRKILSNVQMDSRLIEQCCLMNKEASDLLENAIMKLKLSARAYDRILKLARTIADLESVEIINASHIAEAIQYRSLDRKYIY